MELYDLINNIKGNNNEEVLKEKIKIVKERLNGLTEERTCKIYSSMLYEELKSESVPSRLISTNDIGAIFDHYFVLVPDNVEGFYVADLTFSQFNKDEIELLPLLKNGYMFMDNDLFKKYINIVAWGNKDISINDLYYKNK